MAMMFSNTNKAEVEQQWKKLNSKRWMYSYTWTGSENKLWWSKMGKKTQTIHPILACKSLTHHIEMTLEPCMCLFSTILQWSSTNSKYCCPFWAWTTRIFFFFLKDRLNKDGNGVSSIPINRPLPGRVPTDTHLTDRNTHPVVCNPPIHYFRPNVKYHKRPLVSCVFAVCLREGVISLCFRRARGGAHLCQKKVNISAVILVPYGGCMPLCPIPQTVRLFSLFFFHRVCIFLVLYSAASAYSYTCVWRIT